MSMYFCDDCQRFHDDDWVPMSERGICQEAEIKRELALSEFKAEGVAEMMKERERRNVH